MTSPDQAQPLFRELSPDAFRLTSKEEVAFEAAWDVLRAFEKNQHGDNRDYVDELKDRTIEYLRGRGEERPLSVFGLSVTETVYGDEGQFDVFVDNRNGRGNDVYRGMLRNAVAAVGIEEPQN